MRQWLRAVGTVAAVCAGPALAQPATAPMTPIPNAGAWLLAAPGQPTECTARLNGPQIDTMLTVNNDGKLVLIAGRPDWRSKGATGPATLQIDSQAARKVTGNYVVNLFLVLVSDDALLQQLEAARQLTWTFKVGKFKADVTGLGAAFEAARACKAALPASPPSEG